MFKKKFKNPDVYRLKFENRIISNGDNCKCYLCFNKFPLHGGLSKHVNSLKHKINLKEISENNDLVLDNLSTLSIEEFKKIVLNFITFGHDKSNSFTCHCCGVSISEVSNVFKHIASAEHQVLVKDDVIPKITYEKDTIFIRESNKKVNMKLNYITYRHEKELFTCSICNFCCDKKQILQHVESKAHNVAVNAKKEINSHCLSKKNIDEKVCQSKCTIVNINYCNLCQDFLKNDRELQCHIMVHVYKSLNIDPCTDIIKISKIMKEKVIIQCRLCNNFLKNYRDLAEHLISNLHSERIKLFKVVKDDVEIGNLKNVQVNDEILKKFDSEMNKNISVAYECNDCNIRSLKKNSCNQYLLEKINKVDSSDTGSKIITMAESKKTSDNIFYYSCFFCVLSFSNLIQLLHHYNSSQHKCKIQCFDIINKCAFTNFKKLNDKEIFECSLCTISTYQSRLTIQHLFGKTHCSKLETKSLPSRTKPNLNNETNINENCKASGVIKSETNQIKTMNDQPEITSVPIKINKIIQIPFSKNIKGTDSKELLKLDTAETNCIDDDLNDLVSMKLNYKLKKKQLPISMRVKKPQTSESNEKNSFNINALLYGQSYIEYCIDSGKRNIYNVDQRFLQLLKLGIALTFEFPHHSERMCLPCGVYFSDENQLLFEHLHCQEHINNLLKLEADDKEFENFKDQYSDLKLAKLYMQEESDDLIYCHACDINIKNDNLSITLHSENLNHISKSECWKKKSDIINQEFSSMICNNWYFAENFFCEVCKVKIKYEIEFIIHLQKVDHIKNVNRLKSNKVELKFGCCYTCISYWYGKADFYEKHIKDNFHKLILVKGSFTIPEMRSVALNYMTEINNRMDALLSASDRVQLEKVKETDLIKDIEITVESKFPNAKTYIFGSRISYLGFPDSDVDVFLDCHDTYNQNISQKESKEYLLKVEQLISNKKEIWSIDETLLSTRVPILKLVHKPTGLKCDISTMNGLGVEKSSLIG